MHASPEHFDVLIVDAGQAGADDQDVEVLHAALVPEAENQAKQKKLHGASHALLPSEGIARPDGHQ